MTDCNPLLISAYEPIVGGIMTIGLHEDGWAITVRHRHSFGRLGDCPEAVFGALDVDELVQVFEATVGTWGWPAPLLARLEPH